MVFLALKGSAIFFRKIQPAPKLCTRLYEVFRRRICVFQAQIVINPCFYENISILIPSFILTFQNHTRVLSRFSWVYLLFYYVGILVGIFELQLVLVNCQRTLKFWTSVKWRPIQLLFAFLSNHHTRYLNYSISVKRASAPKGHLFHHTRI